MATKKSTKVRTTRKSTARKPFWNQESVLIAVVILVVLLALLALSDHGVRWQAPVYIETTEAPQATEVAVTEEPTDEAKVPAMESPVEQEVPSDAQQIFVPFEPEGGIPYSGSDWNADVAPDEIEVLTAGPATIAGVTLPGGEKRGSVIIMLPGKKVVSYKVTGLVPGANWHASYRPFTKVDETLWRALVADRVSAMFSSANNCSLGIGCDVVDVLVVAPDGTVIAQWVENK